VRLPVLNALSFAPIARERSFDVPVIFDAIVCSTVLFVPFDGTDGLFPPSNVAITAHEFAYAIVNVSDTSVPELPCPDTLGFLTPDAPE